MKRLISIVNILAVVSGCVMIVAMLFPWWRVAIVGRAGTNVYPYLIDGAASEFLGYKRSTPMIIFTVVLAICIILCFVGSFLKGIKGRIALGVAGIFALLATAGFVYRISYVCKTYGLVLQGKTFTSAQMVLVEVATEFKPGIYLIIAAGVLCLISCALHGILLRRS